MDAKQKKSLLFKLANQIAKSTYKKAKEEGVAGNLRQSDYMKWAFAEAKKIVDGYDETDTDTTAFKMAIIESQSLITVPYNKFRGTELTTHPGSNTWWMRNKVGTLHGSIGRPDDVDLRKYEEFTDGYYEDRSGNIIIQKTQNTLECALYTQDHGRWNGIYTFKTGLAGDKSDMAYIHSYKQWTKVFIYPYVYETMKQYLSNIK